MRQWNMKKMFFPIVLVILFAGILFYSIFAPKEKYSDTERRVLAQVPAFSMERILSGKFMKEFEDYALDQFPLRDGFREAKALMQKYVFRKKDNNELYTAKGHISKLIYPLQTEMLDYAAERFQFINDNYLEKKGITPYLAIVPDKNYYLAKENNYLSLNYDELVSYMIAKTPYMQYVDIFDCLELEDYYRTDTHWRQECIQDVADEIAYAMGTTALSEYEVEVIERPFYGVYYGQAALPVKADELAYIINEKLEQCIVTNYDSGQPKSSNMYDMEKTQGKDMYEIFLSGAVSLLTIENPNAESDKELVLFRDSFGSSLAPFLVPGYKKITLVDIRYIQSGMLGEFISFENADVLFLYSTLLLNNSLAMK